MNRSVLAFLFLASCSADVSIVASDAAPECLSADECQGEETACRPLTCEQGRCIVLVREDGPCPYPDGGTGACNRGECE